MSIMSGMRSVSYTVAANLVIGFMMPTWSSGTIILVLVGIVIFVLIRELFCWYWKFNEMVTLLREIRDRLPEQK